MTIEEALQTKAAEEGLDVETSELLLRAAKELQMLTASLHKLKSEAMSVAGQLRVAEMRLARFKQQHGYEPETP